MEGPHSSSDAGVRITSERAARILLSPADRRFLEPFIGRARTTAQAAREVGVPVETMSYRVRSLMGHGLLERAGSVARKGRPMTLYQAPSKLEAPLDLLPYDDVRGYFERVDAVGRELFLSALAARAARARLAQWVVQLYRADDGGVHLDLAAERGQVSPSDLQAPAAPAIAFNWIPAHLSPEEAKELQHELAALVARFADTQDGAGEPTHLLGVFLTPLDHPTRRRD